MALAPLMVRWRFPFLANGEPFVMMALETLMPLLYAECWDTSEYCNDPERSFITVALILPIATKFVIT